jgi:hypothetical protein
MIAGTLEGIPADVSLVGWIFLFGFGLLRARLAVTVLSGVFLAAVSVTITPVSVTVVIR